MKFEDSKITIEPILDTLEMKKIEDRFYFGDEYKDYISNSRLTLINPEQIVRKEGETPIYGSYQEYLNGFDNIYRESFYLGTAFHQGFLQPEYFEMCDSVNRPSGLKGYIADSLYNDGIFCPTYEEVYEKAKEVNYYKKLFSDNRCQNLFDDIIPYLLDRYQFEKDYDGDKQLMYLSEFQRDLYYSAMYLLNNHPGIQAAMHPTNIYSEPISLNEEAIIVHLSVTVDNSAPFILKLKAKLDNLVINEERNMITVNDLKTHGRDLLEFPNAIIDFHYYREIAIYSYLLSLVAKKYYNFNNDYKVCGNFIVATTNADRKVGKFSLTNDLYEKGIEEYQRLIRMVAYYTYYGI